MKKVLFLINTLNGGGAEKVLVDTVNNLDHTKYDITVQTVFDEGVYKAKLSKIINYKTIILSKNKLIKRILSRVLFTSLVIHLTYRFFIEKQYDYEIAFLEGLPTKIISKSTSKKAKKYAWVHTDLNSFPDSYKAYGTEAKEEEAYRSFDKIFCVSDAVRNEFLKKYKIPEQRVKTLYNVIDDTQILKKSHENTVLTTTIKPLFVTVGRLVTQKGYERLLRVHHRLINEGYEHALMIIGSGELHDTLADYIKENNLTKSAFLMGFQSNPHKYVSTADMFICSSIAEGYSMVVSEAVICGTPVLSTDVAGIREPIENPRYSVVVENSEQALYEGIRTILIHPEKLDVYKNELYKKQVYLKKDFLISEFEREVFNEN